MLYKCFFNMLYLLINFLKPINPIIPKKTILTIPAILLLGYEDPNVSGFVNKYIPIKTKNIEIINPNSSFNLFVLFSKLFIVMYF